HAVGARCYFTWGQCAFSIWYAAVADAIALPRSCLKFRDIRPAEVENPVVKSRGSAGRWLAISAVRKGLGPDDASSKWKLGGGLAASAERSWLAGRNRAHHFYFCGLLLSSDHAATAAAEEVAGDAGIAESWGQGDDQRRFARNDLVTQRRCSRSAGPSR